MRAMRVVGVFGVLLFSGVALAGARYDSELNIDYVGMTVYGSLPGVRHSSDSNMFLGCSITALPTGLTGVCTAKATGHADINCRTENQYLIEAIKSITDSGHLSFSWNHAGECTAINVGFLSSVGPKK